MSKVIQFPEFTTYLEVRSETKCYIIPKENVTERSIRLWKALGATITEIKAKENWHG